MPTLLGPIARLCTIACVSALYSFSVNGGIINGSELSDYVAGYAPPYFAVLWVAQDARRTGYWPAYHYGLYLWICWFILIPHYVIKTRGRAGVALTLGLTVLLWAPVVSAAAGWWFYDQLPDFR